MLDQTNAVFDTFGGSVLNLIRWSVDERQAGDLQLRPSAVTVVGDALVIGASMDGTTRVSGAVSLRESQTYGRFEVRLLLVGDQSATARIGLRSPGAGFGSGSPLRLDVVGSGWQTLVIDWQPNKITLLRDGVEVGSVIETGANEVPDDSRALSIEFDPPSGVISGSLSLQAGQVVVKNYKDC